MSRRDKLLRRLEQRWIACFGEPPTLCCDPDLMAEILAEAEPPGERPRRVSCAVAPLPPQ